jgi:4-aminobutyrate aminotransferase-like enzyme
MTSRPARPLEAERGTSRYGLAAQYHETVLEYGSGAQVTAADGARYLDLFAGAGRCLIGHGHPGFAAAVADQAHRLVVSRHATAVRARYTERLLSLVPAHLDHATYFSTGSEAVDAAVRLARAFTGRTDVVVFDRAFHGRTTGTEPLTHPAPWTQPHAGAHVHRVGFPVAGTGGPTAAEILRDIRRAHARADGGLAAVLVEPVQATGGNRPPVPGFLAALGALAAQLGALVIADEIVTGFGRTGTMLAAAAEGLRADVVTLGKGMANGFPVSALLTAGDILAPTPLAASGALSSTFGGNPLAMAAAAATLEAVLADGLADAARGLGGAWLRELADVLGGLSAVRGVHGKGLMIGVRLAVPPDSPQMRRLSRSLLDQRVLVGISGDTLRLNPPLVITPGQLHRAADALAAALAPIGDGA